MSAFCRSSLMMSFVLRTVLSTQLCASLSYDHGSFSKRAFFVLEEIQLRDK